MSIGWARGLLIGLLFFLSGFTGLVYEVIWAKYLALLLGSTAYAQVGVLAVFMSGLAIGSVIWGTLVDRTERALAVYGGLEIGIGVCAAAFAYGFDALSYGYWSSLAAVGNDGVAAMAIKIGLCALAMLPATVCMGGTLPVLSRALGLSRPGVGRGVAYLYAVNSVGAALGAVVTGFHLVARWGFDAPFVGAAVVNVAIGLVAVSVAGKSPLVPLHQRGEHEKPGTLPRDETQDIRGYAALVLGGAAVSGAVAMVYEVAWIRLCSLVLGSSTYSFSIMLAAFITGIAAGSLVYTLAHPARGRPLRFFAYASLVAALALLLCLPFYDRLPYYAGRLTWWLRQSGASFETYQAAMLLGGLVVMLPLTLISGLNFPALAHAAVQTRSGVGRPVSHVLFANTAGTIVGAAAGGLYLLPAVGLRGTFLLSLAATVIVSVVILVADRSLSRRRIGGLVALGLVGIAGYAAWVPPWDPRLLVAGEFRRHEGIGDASLADYRAALEHQVVFYEDGISATISVEARPPDEIVLRVNGKADASARGDRDTQLLFGHLPAVLHPAARRVLVIGYGSGMTVGAVLQHPVESVDIVEISPEVIAADQHFRAFNHDPLHDPRTRVHIEDARTFLYRTSQHYDLIISEPSNPWIAGIGNLFSAEFFAQARRRLAPDGVLVQWFHSYDTSDALVALVLRTVAQGFAEMRVFQPNRWDFLLVAAPTPRPLSRAAMQRAFQDAAELRSIGITHLSTLLGLETLPDALVRQLGGRGELNRDRMPLLEYAAPRAFFDGQSANLVTGVNPIDAGDFIQSTADVEPREYAELVAYLDHADMLQSNQTLRLLAAWLARAPGDPAVVQALANWMMTNPNSPLLLPALTRAAADADPALLPDIGRVLLRVVRSLRLPPDTRDIATVAPTVEAAARIAAGRSLLEQLGNLYFAARAYPQALQTFDAALAHPASSPQVGGSVPDAPLHCARGLALEKMGDNAAARAAFQNCVRADASNAQAQAALRRLDAAGRGH